MESDFREIIATGEINQSVNVVFYFYQDSFCIWENYAQQQQQKITITKRAKRKTNRYCLLRYSAV